MFRVLIPTQYIELPLALLHFTVTTVLRYKFNDFVTTIVV